MHFVRYIKRRQIINGRHIPIGHRVTKRRHETTLSLNGAMSPTAAASLTGRLDAVLPIGQYYA